MYKPSEVIRLAVTNWRYPYQCRFLCTVLDAMAIAREITEPECYAAHDAIKAHIGNNVTLSNHLKQVFGANAVCEYFGPINGSATHTNDLRLQFWAVLLWDLTRKEKSVVVHQDFSHGNVNISKPYKTARVSKV